MKLSIGASLAFAAIANAHCIFQNLSVDGKDQGSLKSLRAPNQNSLVQNVNTTSYLFHFGFRLRLNIQHELQWQDCITAIRRVAQDILDDLASRSAPWKLLGKLLLRAGGYSYAEVAL